MEEVIRPLTELGVYRITPLFTQRTEGKGSDFKYQSKIVKWRKLAIEGCKQSGNPWIPVFENPQNIEKFLVKTGEKDELWLGSLRATATRLQPSFDLKALSILIGPEGGWSKKKKTQQSNWVPNLFFEPVHFANSEWCCKRFGGCAFPISWLVVNHARIFRVSKNFGSFWNPSFERFHQLSSVKNTEFRSKNFRVGRIILRPMVARFFEPGFELSTKSRRRSPSNKKEGLVRFF